MRTTVEPAIHEQHDKDRQGRQNRRPSHARLPLVNKQIGQPHDRLASRSAARRAQKPAAIIHATSTIKSQTASRSAKETGGGRSSKAGIVAQNSGPALKSKPALAPRVIIAS